MQSSDERTGAKIHMDEKQMLKKIARILRENNLITPEEEAAMIEQILCEG